jgi:hypothetical protein
MTGDVGLVANRGDWTPLELFLAGVPGWKTCLQQLIGGLADGK